VADFKLFPHCTGFEWDRHNSQKNWEKHKVAVRECEELFFNAPLVVKVDSRHSQDESRFYCLGRTDLGRLLFVVFTMRGTPIRAISARDMQRKEREVYRSL
jgi:uncharacterized protein